MAQRVEAVAVKLDIEALFQAIILLPNLMSDQQQHLRATGVMIIKDQPIEEGFNLFPHAPLRLFPDRFFIQHRFILRQNPTLNVIDQPLYRVARAQQPDQAGLRLDKQRLLLAHRFAERWRRGHDILRQIVQPHGQHFAARRPGPG